MEKLPELKDLLEAGVHFGHQTKRWNPKMREYIFTDKNDIHIIDLSKTLDKLQEALDFLEKKASEGEVLFVGTKRQAQEVVEKMASENNIAFVTNRWVGGLLTNFNITKKNIGNMLALEDGMVKGFENRTKQEILLLGKELERLQRLYSGIRKLSSKPSVIVLVDPKHERIAINEAKKLNIPVVAVVDTNCDPDEVTYAIPGNDDAIRSITLFFNLFTEAVKNGKLKAKENSKKLEEKKATVKPAPKKEEPVKKEIKEVKEVKAVAPKKAPAKPAAKKTSKK